MGRRGISYEDVVKAIEILRLKGIKPSVEQIRFILETGSKSTILTHFRTWKTEQDREGRSSMNNETEQELRNRISILEKRLLNAERLISEVKNIISGMLNKDNKYIDLHYSSQFPTYPINNNFSQIDAPIKYQYILSENLSDILA